MSSDTEGLIYQFADERGWDDSTIIMLLCTYIGNQQSNDALEDFLQSIVDEEEAEAGNCVACGHAAHDETETGQCSTENCNCQQEGRDEEAVHPSNPG